MPRRIGAHQPTLTGLGENRQQRIDRAWIAFRRERKCIGAADQFLARTVSVPLIHLFDRPVRIAIAMANVTRVRYAVMNGIFRHGNAHRVVANLGLDAEYRPRHVAFDARTARAARRVMRMRGDFFADLNMTPRTKSVGRRTKLRILLDLDFVHGTVTRDAGRPAFEKALALPQPVSVI